MFVRRRSVTFGIIGAGKIGGTMARLLVRAGHQVILSNRRGGEGLDELLAELGGSATAAQSADDAAQRGDVVFLAVPFRDPEALPSPDAVAGKIVIDAMNPFVSPGGAAIDLGTSSSSEETQKRLPRARVVKAFNTVWFKELGEQGSTSLPEEERRAIFVASDDADARAQVADVVRQLGYAPVDLGALREGVRVQPGSPVYNKRFTPAEARAQLGLG
jgi:predicted dinucleotide-binding enzyme